MTRIKDARGHCTVSGGEKLSPGSGGSAALCRTIEHAIAARHPRGDYLVEVKVVSGSRLAAALVVNGRALPEQRFAVMDRELSPGSFQHFADSLAELIAEAARK